MKEKNLTKLCIIITIFGILLFFANYKNEFEEKTISEMISVEGNKGIVFGRVSFILKKEPLIFFIENDEKVKVFSQKNIDIKNGDIVKIYAETTIYNGEKELIALKVIKQ